MKAHHIVLAIVALLCLVASPVVGFGNLRSVMATMQAAKLQGSRGYVAVDPLPDDIDRNDLVEHHSFHPPLLADFPFDSGLVHWDFGMSTAATDNYMRLTPAKQSREGYLWNDVPCYLKSWTANIAFRVHSLNSLGGDGFAFWYSEERSMTGGPLFGAKDSGFKGLGIIMDSFDNDNARDNPSVSVIVGNGQDSFDTSNDLKDQVLGSCTYDFRNSAPNDLIRLTVEYDPDSGLQVSLISSRQQSVCTTISPLTLPEGYFFGFTAHTGHLADMHDIHYFTISSSQEDRKQETEAAAAAAAAAAAQQANQGYQNAGQQQDTASDQVKPHTPYSHDDERREKQRWE